MENPGLFIVRHFWAIGLVVTFINVAIMYLRVRGRIAENPELAEGYRRLTAGFATFMGIPLLVMGFGIVHGGVPTVFHFFNPADLNPYVLAWHASVVLSIVAVTAWMTIGEGARKIVKHPGLLTGYVPGKFTEGKVILLWLLSAAGAVSGIVMMWVIDIPVDEFFK